MFILAAWVLGQQGALPSGYEVVARCRRAYDAAQTFTEDITATTSGIPGGSPSTATGHVVFKRPGKLRVTGRSLLRSDYQALCANGHAWVFNGGQWSSQPTAEMAIATITGVSGNAAMAVPSLLLRTQWGSIDLPAGTTANVSSATVAGPILPARQRSVAGCHSTMVRRENLFPRPDGNESDGDDDYRQFRTAESQRAHKRTKYLSVDQPSPVTSCRYPNTMRDVL